ncbi:hypothetical protein DFP72DRAFT_857660 [Ephemerocybe angulata]|uniref:Uncharacterized protein n=1 Tax=Ephemerocybe angulata TaxID=980116 RepID=A0A8H6HCF1_9AGAR|nr:hypothetical protein DFP72DRAFT_857660 [Tulosesus angulatus]
MDGRYIMRTDCRKLGTYIAYAIGMGPLGALLRFTLSNLQRIEPAITMRLRPRMRVVEDDGEYEHTYYQEGHPVSSDMEDPSCEADSASSDSGSIYMDTEDGSASGSSDLDDVDVTTDGSGAEWDGEDARMSDGEFGYSSDSDCSDMGGTTSSSSFNPYEMMAELQYGKKTRGDAYIARFVTGTSLVEGFSLEEDEAVRTLLLTNAPGSSIDGEQLLSSVPYSFSPRSTSSKTSAEEPDPTRPYTSKGNRPGVLRSGLFDLPLKAGRGH